MIDSLVMFLLLLFIYFIPSIVALNIRLTKKNIITDKKTNATSIFVLNFFLGWTLVGWVIALVWAVSDDSKPKNIVESKGKDSSLDLLKKQFAEGKISEKEYKKKKEILKEK